MKHPIRNIIPLLAILVLCMLPSPQASAAVDDWQKGVSIRPTSPNDFSSESFKESIRNLASTHANYVSLVIPYYQSNIYSTDLAAGSDTPTEASIRDAVDYIHSQGMQVMLKPHAESYDGQWRALINPSDRQGWFNAYGNILRRLATIGEEHGVEQLCIGTELVAMASGRANDTNTQHWRSLITDVRGIYSGSLTYSANHGAPFDEKNQIQFWPELDYISVSAYHPLSQNDDPTLEEMMAAWDEWNNAEIRPLHVRFGKPILFPEVGYRSVRGAVKEPANYWSGGPYDEEIQARAYEALFQYWDAYPYMQGVLWWDWKSNPNAGGAGDIDFTPQHKKAQGTMTQWFGSGEPAPPPPPCAGTATNAFYSCFFRGRALANLAALVRTDSAINFSWGGGSPDPSLPSDNFSLRSQGDFTFENGAYEFTAAADDGVRVYVDDVLIIDKWIDQAETAHKATRQMTAGTHRVRYEYFENGGNAAAKLSWVRKDGPAPASCNVIGNGLFKGCYFSDRTLSSLVFVRDDQSIDFGWGGGSPDQRLSSDNYSARWEGNFTFEAGEHAFIATADDGVRVYVDDVLIIDKWIDQGASSHTGLATLGAGTHKVRMEYYEHGGDAVARLRWERRVTSSSRTSSSVSSPASSAAPSSVASTPASSVQSSVPASSSVRSSVSSSVSSAPAAASCGSAASNAFTSCFFAGRSLAGPVIFSRRDTALNFTWNGGSPDPALPSDDFSLRSQGDFVFENADYEFTAAADDGVRLYVDDILVIDKWIDQAETAYKVTRAMTAGTHRVRYEYFENGGNAAAKLSWVKKDPPPPAPTCDGVGNGVFKGCYFSERDLSALMFSREDQAIDFDWRGNAPDPRLQADRFSVRWVGDFLFEAGSFTFTATADDGVRVYVDDVLIIDRWIDQAATPHAAVVPLAAGTHRVRMEYYEHGGEAVAKLRWQPGS